MATVLITGGTGLVGKTLTQQLLTAGYKVIILSRNKINAGETLGVSYALWNIDDQKIDTNAIAQSDYIIHLAGAGVMEKRWTEKYKQQVVESRTKSSALLVKALNENKNNVKAIISASAIGWYGADETNKDYKGFTETDLPSENFLGQTCKLWEESIEPVALLNKRLVIFRFGIILSNDGGALAEFKKPLQFGIAAILGNGKQMISWIHIEDVCRMLLYAVKNEQLTGSYNAVAPAPVNNKTLIMKLGELMRKQFFIPVYVPQFILKIFLGESSIEILKSTTVDCGRIKSKGFTFLYPSIDEALKQLVATNKK